VAEQIEREIGESRASAAVLQGLKRGASLGVERADLAVEDAGRNRELRNVGPRRSRIRPSSLADCGS
jgi:hypothetical protein